MINDYGTHLVLEHLTIYITNRLNMT